MSDGEDLERIRERKREELLESAGGGDVGSPASSGGSTSSGDATTPHEPIHVDGGDEFETVVRDHPVVLLEFYADWCGPCKALEPTLEELAATTDAAIAKVDVDANGALASRYRVRGVPTMVLFSDGEAVERLTGARDGATLERLIEQYA
jgi:thioredoxin 1